MTTTAIAAFVAELYAAGNGRRESIRMVATSLNLPRRAVLLAVDAADATSTANAN